MTVYPETLTNFGLHICEDGANVEGKLLGKGAVFRDGDALGWVIKPLLHTGLSDIGQLTLLKGALNH